MNKIYTFLCLVFALLVSQHTHSQALTKIWDKTLGGSNTESANSAVATSDGGYVIAGSSQSGISGDKSEASKGETDYWIVKINSIGQKVWDKTFGGSNYDNVSSIITTSDGGFIVVGDSQSGISGDKTEANKGGRDYWIVKINSLGQKVWDKTIGGNNYDYPSTIISTSDGGFVIAGVSNSGISGDKTEANKGNTDFWIVKINGLGQKVWDKTLGGSTYEYVNSIITSSDGGFIIAGSSESGISGDKTEANKGSVDFWIVKLNSLGQKVWDKTIGGIGGDRASSVTTSSDGGFVVAGSSSSGISGDKTEANRGIADFWIVKINSLGQKLWDKTIGGSLEDLPTSILSISDGGFVISGISDSGISGDKTEASKGSYDYWMLKLNSSGQKMWDKTFGGSGADYNRSMISTNDGGYLLVGDSYSPISGDKSEANKGSGDFWIVKISGETLTFDSATSGNWDVTSTWICGCIPNGTLPVRVMSTHIITVPTAYTGQAKGLRFMSTGKVTLQGTGTVNVVN